jgi:hypothetical protein
VVIDQLGVVIVRQEATALRLDLDVTEVELAKEPIHSKVLQTAQGTAA